MASGCPQLLQILLGTSQGINKQTDLLGLFPHLSRAHCPIEESMLTEVFSAVLSSVVATSCMWLLNAS